MVLLIIIIFNDGSFQKILKSTMTQYGFKK